MEADARRAALIGVLGVLGVVLLVGLGAWAATIGSGDLFRGDGAAPSFRSPTPTPTTGATTADAAPGEGLGGSWDWLRWVAIAVLVWVGTMLLGLAWLAMRTAVVAWSGRRRRDPAPEPVEFEVRDERHRLADELTQDADRRRALLLDGEPRNAIVACWHAFEVSAARAGRPRAPWETPAEFTMTILDLVEADHGAVGRLAEHYREARFSAHPVTEADRADALAALDRIHASLPTPVR